MRKLLFISLFAIAFFPIDASACGVERCVPKSSCQVDNYQWGTRCSVICPANGGFWRYCWTKKEPYCAAWKSCPENVLPVPGRRDRAKT